MLLHVLELAFGNRRSSEFLVPGGLAALQRRFNVALLALGLQGCHYTLGSLRAGGATHHFLLYGNLASLMFRGRWDSARTLNHYVHMGLAAMTAATTPLHTTQLVQCLSDGLEDLLVPEAFGTDE